MLAGEGQGGVFERGLFFKCHNGRDDLWTQVQQSGRLFHDGPLRESLRQTGAETMGSFES